MADETAKTSVAQVKPEISSNSASDLVLELESPATKKDAVPNGGLLAWLQVLGAFFLFLNTW